MEISYDMTLEDLLAFSRHCLTPDAFRSLRRNGLLLVGFGALLIAGLVVASVRSGQIPTYFGAAAAFNLFMVLAGIVCLRGARATRTAGPIQGALREKLLNQPWAKQGIGPARVTIDEEGVVEERRLTTFAFDWAAVDRVTDNPDHIFIFLADKTGVIIPKRATPDPAAVLRLITDFRAHPTPLAGSAQP